jgi:glycosyltransferase involved in cell wall biosynthesis
VADGWVANYHKVIGDLPLVFTTSNWVTDVFKRDGTDVKNFRTLPIGFDPEEVKPFAKSDPKIKKLRRMLGVQDHEKMILTVGGDVSSKGAQEMFRAIAKLGDEAKDWKYVLKHWDSESAEVHGSEEDALIEELGLDRNRITYLSGAFSHDFMPYLLSAADIYAAPSRLEGFGMIQMEAEACGVPVISINTGGPADTVIHGETGFLAGIGETIDLSEEWAYEHWGFEHDHKIVFDEPKTLAYRADIDELADYTLRLLSDDKLREEMGRKAHEHAMANYQYVDVAKKALDHIKAMTDFKN